MKKQPLDKSLIHIARSCLPKISTQEIYEWARTNVYLSGKSYNPPGPFQVERSNYMIEPFKALKDFDTLRVVINKAIQTGGSLIAEIYMLWLIACRPGPTLFCQKTQEMTKDTINDRLYTVISSCPSLAHLLPKSDKDFTDTGIKFPHMNLYVGSAKESAFQAKSIQYVIGDEIHLWASGLTEMALRRTTAFDRTNTSKQLLVSQPGQVGDDFDQQFTKGTMEEWSVPCDGCGKYSFPTWRQQREDGSFYGILWDNNEKTKVDDKWVLRELLPTVRYECKHCGHKHKYSNLLLNKWNSQGKYIQTNNEGTKKIRSFRWNSLIKDNWEDLVVEFLDATEKAERGIYDNLTNFFAQRMTQPYDPDRYNKTGGILKTEVYEVNGSIDGEVFRCMTVDVQKNWYWCLVMSWGKDGCKMLYYGKVLTSDKLKEIQTQFKIGNQYVFLDVANAEWNEDIGRHEVYDLIERMQWGGLRGDHWHDRSGWKWGNQGIKFFSQPQPIPNTKTNRKFFNFSPNAVRDIAKGLRDNKYPYKAQFLDNNDFKQQMFAEVQCKVKDKYGRLQVVWKNPNQKANHAWDCFVLSIVVALMHKETAHQLLTTSIQMQLQDMAKEPIEVESTKNTIETI